MELKNLTTFLQVVELKSFTKAAEALGYTQSTISFQINQLEEELGCPLFDRIGHNIYLTERGALLQKHALQVKNSMSDLLEEFQSDEELIGTVHLYTSDSICEKMMLDNYAHFYQTYPKIKLIFSTGSTTDLLSVLERNESDVIFTLDEHVYRQNFVIAKESPVKLRFVTSMESPLSKQEKVTLSEILKYPFLLTERGMSYRKVLDDYLATKNQEVKPVLETGRTDIIIKCLKGGTGISFLPEFVVREEIETGELVYLNVDDISITIWKQLIHRKDKWVSKSLRAFLEFVMEHEFTW